MDQQEGSGWRRRGSVTLSDMFAEEDARSFEERRDEVIAIVIQATDLRGREQHLRRAVSRCRKAHNEQEFDRAYETLVDAISRAPLSG
jgi:hypothetical protein